MWQFVQLLFQVILYCGVMSIPVLVVIAIFAKRRRAALPSSSSGVERSVRLVETIALACLTACIVVMIASLVPWLTKLESSGFQRQPGWQVAGGCVVACLGCLAVSLWRSTAVATFSLAVVLTVAASLAVHARHAPLSETAQAEFAKTPIPVIITVEGIDRSADVMLNGVRMGKTPVHTTVEDIQATVPVWEDVPEKFGPMRDSANRPCWIPLSLSWSVLDGNPSRLELFAMFERDGQPLTGYRGGSGSGGGRGRAWVGSCLQTVRFDPKTSNQETDRLLNIARLQDYAVDAAWVDAFVEMVPGSWQHLLRNLSNEPELSAVKTVVLRRYSRIDDVTDHESAWRLMDDISQRAVEERAFDFESIDAHTIEFLIHERLEQLGQEELFARFEQALRQVGSLWHDVWYRYDDAGRRIAIHARDPGRINYVSDSNNWTDADARLHPLRHAVLRLDQRLDADAESRGKVTSGNAGNFVERRVVPLLLCREMPEFDLASEIGGPVIEQFLLRHDWMRIPDSNAPYSEDVRKFSQVALVSNAWFHRLIRLNSPLGRKLRSDHQGRILGELNQFVRSRESTIDDDDHWAVLGPCFVDDDARELLATTFWPTFNRHATTWPDDGNFQVKLRWSYLMKMWPYSTVEQFADVYEASGLEDRITGSSLPMVDRLPPDDVFRILDALIAATKEREKNDTQRQVRARKYPRWKPIYEFHRERFERFQRELPCVAAAQRAVEHFLTLKEYQQNQTRERLIDLASRNAGWCEVFAKAESSEIRMMVPAATLQRPTPANRKSMKSLEDDESQSVRDSVVSVRAALAELKKIRN